MWNFVFSLFYVYHVTQPEEEIR